MGNWLWILILIFFVFRLLLKAGKNIGSSPPSREREGGDRPPPAPEQREAIWERLEDEEEKPRSTDFRNPLLQVLEEMAGTPRPRPVIPPPPRGRIVREVKAKVPETAPPEEITTAPEFHPTPLPIPEESTPAEERLIFSSHPVLQGIIFSEILTPPLALRDTKAISPPSCCK